MGHMSEAACLLNRPKGLTIDGSRINQLNENGHLRGALNREFGFPISIENHDGYEILEVFLERFSRVASAGRLRNDPDFHPAAFEEFDLLMFLNKSKSQSLNCFIVDLIFVPLPM